MEQDLSIWHDFCDTVISFKPTTPVLSVPTTTYNDDYCQGVVRRACDAGRVQLGSCSAIITDEVAFSSCMCTPPLLLADYTCEFMGNTSCFSTGATLSSLIGYSDCPNFQEVIADATVSGLS